jgi:nucleotide-binding universal stress UspA family protein
MYSCIVVPLDGSDFGDAAIPFAASIARRTGAEIELVHVHQHQDDGPYLGALTPFLYEGESLREAVYERRLMEKERSWLQTRAARLLAESGVFTTYRLLHGGVASALQQEMERVPADLVVMSTHARHGISRWRHGSMGDAMMRHSKRPIMLVPAGDDPQPLRGHELRNILIPLDGSDFSEQVLEPVLHLARLIGARVTLFHAIVPPFAPLAAYEPSNRDLTVPTDCEFERYLQSVAKRLTGLIEPATVRTVVSNAPASAIVELLGQNSFDVVAMATHGRGGVTRMLTGSTADQVLCQTHVPVLLVRPQVAKDKKPELRTVSAV